jgi:uncharacterized membrane protein
LARQVRLPQTIEQESFSIGASSIKEPFMAKTASFGVMHLGIAFSVSYILTGSVAISGAITLIEPLCNTVAHYFFDKYWGHPKVIARIQSWRVRLGRQQSPAASVGV